MLFSAVSLIAGMGFAGLASSSPVAMPQGLDFDTLDDFAPIPTPVINPNAVSEVVKVDTAKLVAEAAAAPLVVPDSADAKKLRVRTSSHVCTGGTVQPAGAGPVPDPDTPDAFVSYAPFSAAALGAVTPSGYTNTFKDLKASSNAYGYLGYTTLPSYSTEECAKRCNAITNCAAFNIYFERDPSVDPGTGVDCSNPASTTNIKCAFWGGPVTPANAVNTGQYRATFHVVIAGSNGYVNYNRACPTDYTTPRYIGDAAINAPLCPSGSDPYLGYKLFNDGAPFDIARCAAACTAQAAYERAHPPADGAAPRYCSFFNTYILSRDGRAVGQHCALYSASFGPSYATNVGQYDGLGRLYTISYSYTSSNAANQGTCV